MLFATAGIGEERGLFAALSLRRHRVILISAACRLVPLGQSDAQRVTASINRQDSRPGRPACNGRRMFAALGYQ